MSAQVTITKQTFLSPLHLAIWTRHTERVNAVSALFYLHTHMCACVPVHIPTKLPTQHVRENHLGGFNGNGVS